MKRLWYILLAFMLFFSCSKSSDIADGIKKEEKNKNNDNTSEATPKLIKLKLTTPNKKINIFEMIEFDVSYENQFFLKTMFDLSQVYDSVVWKVSDMKKDFKVFDHNTEKGYAHTSFTSHWGHHFFTPGTIKTYLLGYKNNTVVYADTLTLVVTNEKDFLGYNWKEITEESKHTEGYVDVLSDVQFGTFKTIHGNIPGVRFYLWSNHSDSDTILFEYITKTYSAPVYTNENAGLLLKKYHELFNYKKEKAHPQCIWITPSSKIVLLKCDNEYTLATYEIYAEPR